MKVRQDEVERLRYTKSKRNKNKKGVIEGKKSK